MSRINQDIITRDCISQRGTISAIRSCPRKTFSGINNLLNLKRPIRFRLSSWTLISLIVILTFAFILEFSTVTSLPTKSKLRDHHVQSHHHHHNHHHRPSRRHHKHRIPETVEAVPVVPDSSGSLSIVTPLDVLRQNMLNEMQKTRSRQAQEKRVAANKEYLEKIGR